MKTKGIPLTVRRCPPKLHKALKSSADQNHRSLNGEALAWLEREASAEKPKRAKELLPALRKAYRLLSPAEHKAIAAGIEKARQRMAREHLH